MSPTHILPLDYHPVPAMPFGRLSREGFSNRSESASPAFTLVEVLISVAIIAILTALLMPTFKDMQKKAQAASCIENLRQLGVFSTIYAGEHNDEFPPPWTSNAFWLDTLIAEAQFGGDLSKAHEAMSTDRAGTRCKVRLRSSEAYSATFKSAYGSVAARDGGQWWFNYGMNYSYLSSAGAGRRDPIRRVAVQRPSQCIYIADSNIEEGGSPRDINRGWSAAYPADRHNGRSNVLWVDGHTTAETQAWLLDPANAAYWMP